MPWHMIWLFAGEAARALHQSLTTKTNLKILFLVLGELLVVYSFYLTSQTLIKRTFYEACFENM